ncbi:GNAT family N-acetyltransferase [Streptomyces sp. NPDC021224]|uniref:GNAT family N-acetyltransferase n=1 Tax=unclassified Streptomyces TaxID=2593676 RepID=UPI0037933E74
MSGEAVAADAPGGVPGQVRSARLVLTPLDLDADTADLHLAYGDPRIARSWADEEPPRDEAETRERLATRVERPDGRLWTIRRAGEPDALGLVELADVSPTPWLSWMLRRAEWRRGITGEAVAALVEHLFTAGGLERVEAWADASNTGSIGVARRAGLTERGRFTMSTPVGGTREKVVLGRVAGAGPQRFYLAHPVLPVRDVEATLALLHAGLGLEPGFRVGEPALYAAARLGPWSVGPGLRLALAPGDEPIAPVTVALDAGIPLAGLALRYAAAGGRTDGPVRRMPWGEHELCCLLPEGHRLVVSGPPT